MPRLIHLIALFCVSILLACHAVAQDATFLPQEQTGTTVEADPGTFQKLKVTGDKDSVTSPEIAKFNNQAVAACQPLPPEYNGDTNKCVTDILKKDSAVASFLQENEKVQISDDPLERIKTQAMKSMETFLDKRLQETLYGDGMASVANHDTFYGLYQTQLSKLAMKIITDFCLDLDPEEQTVQGKECTSPTMPFIIGSGPVDDKDKDQCNKNFNMNSADKFKCETKLDIVRSKNLACSLGKPPCAPATAQKNVKDCIFGINQFCERKCQDPAVVETKVRACAVAANLRLLASRIKMMDELRVAMEKNKTGQSGFQASTVFGEKCVYGLGNCNKKTKTINELATLTSKELADEKDGAGLEKAYKSESEKFSAACNHDRNSPPSDDCKKLLYDKDHEKEIDKIEQEHNAKTRLISAKIEGMKDPKEVEAYLLSEGMSKEQADKFLKKFYDANKSIDDIKAEIAETYKRERENVIQSIRDQLGNKTYLSQNEVSGLNEDRKTKNKKDYFYDPRVAKEISYDEIENAKKEQARKGELVLAQQTFGNMISSYFELELSNQNKGKPKEKYANPFDAKRELAGSYFVTGAESAEIQRAMDQRLAGKKTLTEDKFNGSSNLPVDYIFQIIDGIQ